MTCTNKVEYWVVRGVQCKKVLVPCGKTDPYGERSICDTCSKDARTMREIEQHEESVAADNAWLRSAGHGEM
tara:strand:+ start:184 stop:399 length:216 start_codon:yes stop_codon:yes gene_type:complete